MKQYKYLIFITLVISSFLFLGSVKADYQATVINPSGAGCSLKENSTGYCYYKNSNLDSYVSGVVWLDTGDEVTVLTNYQTVPTKDTTICSDYYVYTSYYFSATSTTYQGYYCNANLTSGEVSDELKEEFKNLGFPESYYNKLAILRKAHPEWEFKAINTDLDFNEAVKALNIAGRSLIQRSSSNNYAYMASDSTSFDYLNDLYIPYDSKNSSNAWYNANYDTIAYYLDPRNFLIDMYIFQFEGLSYDNSISDDDLNNTISEVFKDDYLYKYVQDFINAGKESKVSPVYLASLSKQEVGGSTTPTSAISGNIEGYEGYYNFYNIGAYSGDSPVINGLSFAMGSDELVQRPWNTEYKAIIGGALWIKENYIGVGQDTSYLKKWNVIYNYLINKGEIEKPYANFTHQYMTNIMAPSSEARTTYKSYYKTGILDSKFVFYIPIFNNMPDITLLPTKGGWPNNYLSELIINDNKVAGFDGEILEYNYYLDINTNKVKLDAKSISNKATISGLGEYDIDKDTTFIIKVTAENGNIKEYKINIILTGEKLEESKDIQTTLNNSGIKNNDKYLSGFNIGTDVNFIKEKLVSTNKDIKVMLMDSSNLEISSGTLKTGDKVKVSVKEEEKEYEVVIYGDANGDGAIDAIDYVRIRKYIMNSISLTGAYNIASDVNKDGAVDAIDYVRIRKYIMNSANIEQ